MTVTQLEEVELNGYKYRKKGAIQGAWIDPFPQQMSFGDPSYSNRIDLSSLIINDLRGGIGVEESDETIDGNRCWWTNCIIKYRNHILPPRLATEVTLPTLSIGWNSPTGFVDGASAWTDEALAYDDNTATKAVTNIAE